MNQGRNGDGPRLVRFFTTDIWRISARELPGKKSFFIRQLRVLPLAVRGFHDDRCQLRASALTYYSLLSVVPLLAMAFGVSKGFGLEARLERQILEALPNQREVALRIIDYAHAFLENTQAALLAGRVPLLASAGSLTVGEVVTRLDRRGVDEVPCGESSEWSRLAQKLDLFDPKIRDASIQAALKDP